MSVQSHTGQNQPRATAEDKQLKVAPITQALTVLRRSSTLLSASHPSFLVSLDLHGLHWLYRSLESESRSRKLSSSYDAPNWRGYSSLARQSQMKCSTAGESSGIYFAEKTKEIQGIAHEQASHEGMGFRRPALHSSPRRSLPLFKGFMRPSEVEVTMASETEGRPVYLARSIWL